MRPAGAIGLNGEIALNGKCQWCMRCVSYCPAQALYCGSDQYARYQPVTIEEILHN